MNYIILKELKTQKEVDEYIDEIYNLIKSDYTYNLLIKAKKFKFKKIGVARADNRIPLLNKMLSYRVSECLKQH